MSLFRLEEHLNYCALHVVLPYMRVILCGQTVITQILKRSIIRLEKRAVRIAASQLVS
jgi:hypothetical protein